MKLFGCCLKMVKPVSILITFSVVLLLLMYSGNFISPYYQNGFEVVSDELGCPTTNISEERELEYEVTRRRIEKRVLEYEKYMSSQLKKIQKVVPANDRSSTKLISDTLKEGREQNRILLNDLDHLKDVAGYELWRERESQELSDIVQLRLTKLQNPTNCSTARKLVCTVDRSCGVGCLIHHAVYCFLISVIENRTLILNMLGWHYEKKLEDMFLPISNTCSSEYGTSVDKWPGSNDTQVVLLAITNVGTTEPASLPLAIPADLSERLVKLHGDPFAWWIGQLLKCLLRSNMKTQFLLDEAEKEMRFKKPIVGIHIRRTDKLQKEAKFHSLDEYMVHVEEYFKKLQMKSGIIKRRIYLASDDPKVFVEARSRYPDYDIIGEPRIAETASSLYTRYKESSLYGIIIDINFLSRSDYLVCTFSSNVCRVAYEIMQQFYPDASQRVRSLDIGYYFY